jgi:hypothetical protein
MKQFDAPKKKKTHNDDGLDDIEADAADLQGALDGLEEELEEDIGIDEGDPTWEFNMCVELTEGEIEEMEATVKPVRCVLTKVR